MAAARKASSKKKREPLPRDAYQVQQVLDYLAGLDDDAASCLGDHHDWGRPPKLAAGALKLPRNARMSETGERDGSYQMRVTCLNGCGRVRTKTTLPGGIWDSNARWEYEGGPRPPRGLGITRGEYAQNQGRRLTEGIQVLMKEQASGN
jgi:hypothetical protein